MTVHAEAKQALELADAHKLYAGIEGKADKGYISKDLKADLANKAIDLVTPRKATSFLRLIEKGCFTEVIVESKPCSLPLIDLACPASPTAPPEVVSCTSTSRFLSTNSTLQERSCFSSAFSELR